MTPGSERRAGGSSGREAWIERSPRAKWLLPLFLVALGTLSWHRLVRSAESPSSTLTGSSMGTTWSLRLPPGSQLTSEDAARLVQARLDEVDEALSTYKEDSELSRFNRHASVEPFPVTRVTRDVFHVAAEVSEQSGGALDVTIRPLVALWGFGAGAQVPGAPQAEALERVRAQVDWRRILIDESAGTIAKTHPETSCDLSAVAKGYAVDRVADRLAEHGVESFLFELGGELFARGARSDGTAWRAGIEAADEGGRSVAEVVELRDAALATSGDYRNFYEENGVRRSHLLDPRSGRPIEHGVASVSVIHAEAAWADAWATALNVLGLDDGLRLAERAGLAAQFVSRGPDGSFTRSSTSAFSHHLESSP